MGQVIRIMGGGDCRGVDLGEATPIATAINIVTDGAAGRSPVQDNLSQRSARRQTGRSTRRTGTPGVSGPPELLFPRRNP